MNRWHTPYLAITVAVVMGCLVGPVLAQGVSDARFDNLRRGVNVGGWFENWSSYTEAHMLEFITDKDMSTIRSMGFDHIRLSIDSGLLYQAGSPGVLNPNFAGHLDRALDMAQAAGLATIVDMHPSADFKRDVVQNNSASYVTFWESLATRLSSRHPDRVFLEVLNEPANDLGNTWPALQKQLIQAIRAQAPQHTIIASGPFFSGVSDLTNSIVPEDVADPNVVYNFHYYRPFEFTHQGAWWAGNPPIGVPWDGSQASLLETDMDQVFNWAKRNNQDPADNVRLTANEFGVYKVFADPADRARWTRDTRKLFDKYDIGWNAWDYTHDFAVMDVQVQADGQRRIDPAMAEALGLSFHRRFQWGGYQGVTGSGDGRFVTNAVFGTSTNWNPSLRDTVAFAGAVNGTLTAATVAVAQDGGATGQVGDHGARLTVDVQDNQVSDWFAGVAFDTDFSFVRTDLDQVILTADVQTSQAGGEFQIRIESSQGHHLAFNGVGTGDWQTIGGLLSLADEDTGFNPWNLWDPNLALKVVVSFINEKDSWLDGGTLTFDNLSLTRLSASTDPAASVPEPTTVAMLVAGLVLILPSRRHRRPTA